MTKELKEQLDQQYFEMKYRFWLVLLEGACVVAGFVGAMMLAGLIKPI